MNYIEVLNRDNFPIVKRKTYTVEGKEKDDFAYRTVVTIKSPEGIKCTGIAEVSKEDAKYYSKIAGFKIAERRAYIGYLKHRIQSMKFTQMMLRRFLKWDVLGDNISNKEKRRYRFKISELSKAIKQARKSLTANYKKVDSIIADVWEVKEKINKKLGQNTEN